MDGCPHLNFIAQVNVNRICNEEDRGKPDAEIPIKAWAMEVTIHCKLCKAPFKFNWDQSADPLVIPLGIEGMSHRPWVSFMNETLGITISPLENGGRYIGQSQEVGHS